MKRQIYVGLGLASLIAVTSCAPRPSGDDPKVLTVFAAASLAEAFTQLGTVYQRQHPDQTVQYNFAGSQQLLLQLRHGAQADIFASADERWMQLASDSGLLAHPAVVFATNRLTVIVPRTNRAGVNRLDDLARPGVKLVLGSDQVPVGRYARQVLRKLSEPAGAGVDFAEAVLHNVVSMEDNTRAVAAKVRLGEADAAIVYDSDVTPELAAEVTVLPIPDRFNVTTTYPIAVLGRSRNRQAAEAFVALIQSAEGQAVLERHGLIPVTVGQSPSGAERSP